MSSETKLSRNYGYDILINNFEPSLREYIAGEVYSPSFGESWRDHIPKLVIDELLELKEKETLDECLINEFFEELTFVNLKDIIVASNHFSLAKPFFGDLSKDKFVELMDDLNKSRRKIAHAKSTFSELDLLLLKDNVRMLCQGEKGKAVRLYLDNEGYKSAKQVPADFFEEYEIQNNLPPESYDLDGGFVGRREEIRAVTKYLKSDQDRVITITGAGGVGKTAIALKVAYSFLEDSQSPFEAIVWFSAKTSKLTDEGIVPLSPDIRSHEQLIEDILNILDPKTLTNFKNAVVPLPSYIAHVYNLFSSNKCLFIVDNLETIIKDNALVKFVTEIPRPSQVLITSRKGLGEFERRYPITDMLQNDAIQLFRIIAKERNRIDLLRLKEESIQDLVKRVRCYPLLIKWSIGQVCLGKPIDEAFAQIFVGESDIARFAFDDVFKLLTDNAKIILYSMIVYGNKPISSVVLMHLGNFDDEEFEDAIKEVIMVSFVFPHSRDTETGTTTEYSMLELTRGFVERKLDGNTKTRDVLYTRLHHLSEQIQNFEISSTSYFQSVISLGIKTSEEQVAFNYVKAAKNFYFQNDVANAEKHFQLAVRIAPKLSYVKTEYSKFKFNTGHRNEALTLAEDAAKANPDSWHVWFNYGVMLKKMRREKDAKEHLLKAKELNPAHLPIYNELGRTYTFLGEFEKAEALFTDALKDVKYPNYRHKMMTLQYLGDNYKRWAQSFSTRHDVESQITKLRLASKTITDAITIFPGDERLWNLSLKICLDMAIAIHHKEGFDAAKPYLDKCLQPTYSGNKRIIIDSRIIATAYFYLAAFSLGVKDRDNKAIEKLIDQGLAICGDQGLFDKLTGLKEQLAGKERMHGKVDYFNTVRSFGIIKSGGKTYIFFPSGFRDTLNAEALHALNGRGVNFNLVKSTLRPNEFIGVDIVLEI